MIGEVFIDEKDAFIEYGISLEQTALSALMTPAGMKSVIENKSRLKNGKIVLNKIPRYDEREITLPLRILAKNSDDFFAKYAKFCDNVLANGEFVINTKYQKEVYYHVLYSSCTQFSEFITEYASFSLKLVEPDPTNRSK